MAKNPFKFLESFEKGDSDRFFGRSRETAQLYNAVHATNLVLLYGGSGTGKTSLVNCGLANKFLDSDWLPIFVRRGPDLNESLRTELTRFGDPEQPATGDLPIREMVRSIYLSNYRPVYLIFDQFEELYILGDEREQNQFHDTLATLLTDGLQCRILIILREDYIAFLSNLERLVPSLFDNRLRIEKMNDHNVSRVIVGTTRYGGIRIDQPRVTVKRIIDNLKEHRSGVDLTNLQVYLDRLWREKSEERLASNSDEVVFSPELVEQVGPFENVLSDLLDDQLIAVEFELANRGVPNPEGLPLEVLFTLVTEDGTKRNLGGAAIRANLPKGRNVSHEHVELCLQLLESFRLLRPLVAE